jgi:hypothetical protein
MNFRLGRLHPHRSVGYRVNPCKRTPCRVVANEGFVKVGRCGPLPLSEPPRFGIGVPHESGRGGQSQTAQKRTRRESSRRIVGLELQLLQVSCKSKTARHGCNGPRLHDWRVAVFVKEVQAIPRIITRMIAECGLRQRWLGRCNQGFNNLGNIEEPLVGNR